MPSAMSAAGGPENIAVSGPGLSAIEPTLTANSPQTGAQARINRKRPPGLRLLGPAARPRAVGRADPGSNCPRRKAQYGVCSRNGNFSPVCPSEHLLHGERLASIGFRESSVRMQVTPMLAWGGAFLNTVLASADGDNRVSRAAHVPHRALQPNVIYL